jgi:putative hemolysin
LRLLGAQNPTSPTVTEEEVKFLIDEGVEIGIFETIEQDILRRVLRIGDRKLSALMTHRTDVVWLDLDDPPEVIEMKIKATRYSNLPVAKGSLDELLGILEVKDYWSQRAIGQVVNIEKLLLEPLFVPEAMTGLELLEQFKNTRTHLAIVVDEFGGVLGLITLTDVFESIVGSLPDVDEAETQEAVQREDGSWLFDGRIPVDELKDHLDIYELPEEEAGNYETLAGLIMEQLSRIPSTGDIFEWNGIRFEVVDMDGHRVDKVLVSFIPIGGGQ